MVRVLLIHGGVIPHYRVPIYGYLAKYLRELGYELNVTSDGIQPSNPHKVEFEFVEMALSTASIAGLIYRLRIDAVIMFVDMRHLYLFPTYLVAEGFLGKKMVWWGQGRDLADRDATIKNFAYWLEHLLCDSIVLYANHLKKYVARRFQSKIFVANNTLVLDYAGRPRGDRERTLVRYGIRTTKNIICVGRLQKRKRLEYLVAAHASMGRRDIGLILVGPVQDDVLKEVRGDNVYKLGPIYGAEKFDLLSAADVYCLPGAVGLSIVDAFHCGLPIVSEEGDESAEIMYLRHGKNGFLVPRGDVGALAERLLLLLDNEALREEFSNAARREIAQNGSMDVFCGGFRDALAYAMESRGGR